MMMRFLLLLSLGLTAGAAGRFGDPIRWCTSRSPLLANLPTTALTGRFDLELTSTYGWKHGGTARGTLELWPRDSAATAMGRGNGVDSTRCEPYAGAATIDLAAVNANTEGSVSSRDSTAPGVVVRVLTDRYVSGKKLELSLGSDRNRRDVGMVDGNWLEVEIEEVTNTGFRGRWRASPPLVAEVTHAGTFTARRVQ
jgi:hypothetical protein